MSIWNYKTDVFHITAAMSQIMKCITIIAINIAVFHSTNHTEISFYLAQERPNRNKAVLNFDSND